MGITKADLDAQRAMLKRGDEKRKAARQAEERERLRDTFAAAALTGLLSLNRPGPNQQFPTELCERTFRWADAMLRERDKPFDSAPTTHDTPPQSRAGKNVAKTVQEVSKCTERENEHDAAPDARARDADRVRTDKATTRPGNGTGNTPSEAEIDALEYVVEEGRTASVDDYGVLRSWLIRLRPEWESQSYEESDKKLTNTNTNRDTTPSVGSVQDKIMTIKPLAYAAVAADGSESVYVASLKEQAEACCRENGWFLLPLYAAPPTWQEEVATVEAAFERSGVKPIWPADEAGNIGPMAEAMADEIERLRTLATHATPTECSVQDRCTLTNAEREAIEVAAAAYADDHGEQFAAVLRNLLVRL